MTYDYAGTWSDASEHSTYAQARSDLAYWAENRTYPAERSVLGMPFYGYCWGASCDHGYTPFSEIAANYPDQTGQDWITAGDRTISFNGTATITKKVQLAKDYGGVMIWELTKTRPTASCGPLSKRVCETTRRQDPKGLGRRLSGLHFANDECSVSRQLDRHAPLGQAAQRAVPTAPRAPVKESAAADAGR